MSVSWAGDHIRIDASAHPGGYTTYRWHCTSCGAYGPGWGERVDVAAAGRAHECEEAT